MLLPFATERHALAASFLLVLFLAACTQAPDPYATWEVYGGDASSSQYSSLDQINRDNVQHLEVAWTYNTGDHEPEGYSQIQCNPIIVDGVLYGASPRLKLFALDAATGESRWVFDPFAEEGAYSVVSVNRGVAYWAEGEDKRILFTAGPFLYAIDAGTGQPISTFGTNGKVDLREGLDRDVTGLTVSANTPGSMYNDLYIIGGRVSEEQPSAPGHIRAFNVRTGAIAWIFHTIPHPGEYGYDTWPEDAWTRIGGANAWSGLSVDHERGMVFIPTGSAAFDFWGGDRKGENLFANTLLALNAETGERLWHFQVVRHDIWDRDLPAAPNLLTLEHNGQRIDAVAQITKSGHVFVFNRETGESLFPLEEKDYPASDLDGEEAWPTQVLPTKPLPFARQAFTEAEVTDISPEAEAFVLDSLQNVRGGGQFIPPSREGTMIFPGFDGGGEWGGAAHDPHTGILYVNSNEMAWVQRMVDLNTETSQRFFSLGQQVYFFNCASCHGYGRQGSAGFPSLIDIKDRLNREAMDATIRAGRNRMPGFSYLTQEEIDAVIAYLFDEAEPATTLTPPDHAIPYTHNGYNRFFDQDGYPAVKPPWGTLNAIDLNTGEYVWTVPLGEYPELIERGLPPTGTENYGGPVVTAGGLVFIGATRDELIRAFDKDTGTELWRAPLPAGGYATPATYSVGGRQYVVIAAGGGKVGTKPGDAYVAFALPDD